MKEPPVALAAEGVSCYCRDQEVRYVLVMVSTVTRALLAPLRRRMVAGCEMMSVCDTGMQRNTARHDMVRP